MEGQNMAAATQRIYEDIAMRTNGDIYIGVVGPVRTGKSTFIKRFMQTLVIPNIDNMYMKERAKDELPQSGSGRTIMTAEPKFVPEEAVDIALDGGATFSVRLIDCVGYMVPGASGQFEDGAERMVSTPWFDHEVTITEAAEKGTQKVIAEHSTIGIVVTTDGTVTEIPREDYIEAERRVICELKALGKPFLVLLNSAQPDSPNALKLRDELQEQYSVRCILTNCMTLTQEDITEIIRCVLYEFPVYEFNLSLPPWVDALSLEHPIKAAVFDTVRSCMDSLEKIGTAEAAVEKLRENENIQSAVINSIDLGSGVISARLELPRELFYTTISSESGFEIGDDGDLMSLLTQLSQIKSQYDRIAPALNDVMEKGYGIVMPDRDELSLEEPEIVKQSGRYGVRLKASAPSIHMIRANIETEVSPAIGGEKSSEEVVSFLLQEFEGDVSKIWKSNLFGKSLNDIASEGLVSKIKKMPSETQLKLQQTLQRIINEGSNGLICIIL
jgi:stage IV sporulation protein A